MLGEKLEVAELEQSLRDYELNKIEKLAAKKADMLETKRKNDVNTAAKAEKERLQAIKDEEISREYLK